MKGVEITEENLEDLLAYDDVFLDYFNAFLALPAFPLPLRYDRLTGTFREAVENAYSLTNPDSRLGTPPYGATDEEKDRQLEWAKQHRLQLFLRTHLFREMKLSKLILRPLEDSASRGSSSNLRGYSRQSDSYVSSLSNSGENSGQYDLDLEEELGEFRRSVLFKYARPGSRAISLPPMFDALFTRQTSASSTVSDESESEITCPVVRSPAKVILPDSTLKKSPCGPRKRQGTGAVTGDSGVGLIFHEPPKSSNVTFPAKVDALISIKESKSGEVRVGTKQGTKTRIRPGTPEFSALIRSRYLERAYSAPCNQQDFSRIPGFDFDVMFGEAEPEDVGQAYVAFDYETSDDRTYTDMKHLEGKHRMTYQEMKEHVLGTTSGFQEFMSFLSDTTGIHLVNFWLDCEYFKDSMQDYDDVENMAARSRLFRDIQDKYSLSLTQEAKDQLTKCASNVDLSHTVFLRTQYDVLRRLRAYWLPRFIIHKEHMEGFRCHQEQHMGRVRGGSMGTFLPSISVARSFPVRPDDLLEITATRDWQLISMGGRDESIRSPQYKNLRELTVLSNDDIHAKFMKALSTDKAAGGPFMSFLEKKDQQMMINKLLLWQDVADYCAEESRSSDRLLRLVHAQSIFNKYSLCCGLDEAGDEQTTLGELRARLIRAKDTVPAALFDEMKTNTFDSLEQPWIRYLKEDLKKYLESSLSHRDSQAPPSSAGDIEVFILDGKIVVRNPSRKKRQSTAASGLTVAESIDEVQRAEEKRLRAERRKVMEKERKKAIRAAKIRLKEMKQANADPTTKIPTVAVASGAVAHRQSVIGSGQVPSLALGREVSDTGPHAARYTGSLQVPSEKPVDKDPERNPDEDRPVAYNEVSGNKTLMVLFKKYLLDQGDKGKEVLNIMNLNNEILTYQTITGSNSQKKKDIQAQQIHRTFLDKQCKKPVTLPERLDSKVRQDKDRPKSPIIKEILGFTKTVLEQNFSMFWQACAKDFGLTSANVNQLTTADVATKIDDFGQGKRKKQLGGRGQPSRDDKIEFLLELEHCARGHLTLTMLYFYAYLGRWAEDDHLPLLDKDLIFYIETQKFKECSHRDSDDELLKRKVQSIINTFLDCNSQPSLQVDISTECYQKTVRFCQRYVHGKDVGSAIFDDAQFTIFKALLPYWAGFKKHFLPDDNKEIPLTKYQVLLRKRLELFQKALTPKDYRLPTIPHGQVAALSFSLLEGMKWKDGFSEESGGRRTVLVAGVRDKAASHDQTRQPSAGGRQTTNSSVATTVA